MYEFRDIRLSDRGPVEGIRRKYAPLLSDYSFAVLYCWKEKMGLTICLERDLYVVRGEGYYFFPVGGEDKIRDFLRKIRQEENPATFRFCDERQLAFARKEMAGCQAVLSEEDCDYEIDNEWMHELPGSRMGKRRNAFFHYLRQTPPPREEPICETNLKELKEVISRIGGADCKEAETAADHFFELGLFGTLVRRGSRCVGFSICSEKDSRTMQGHFTGCMDSARGAGFYMMKSCTDYFRGRYACTNMEDDMGVPGLRTYKRSLETKMISSYTVRFSGEAKRETEVWP